jgi:cupin 2 domain-containing protein
LTQQPLTTGNLFADLPRRLSQELSEVLAQSAGARLERIVSLGHTTPPGEWYDQDTNEWVVLLRGAAVLRFEDEPEPRRLVPGDWLDIPAHRRHRVEWTAPGEPTIWLALHY